MTAGQFWDEDPWLAEAYREAAEYQAQRKSWEMWLQGVYFFNAVCQLTESIVDRTKIMNALCIKK